MTQTVELFQRRQAPPPLHRPSFWQVDAASAAHSLSGSVPLEMPRHRPLDWPVFALEQAMHRPAQADSQQKPSTQLPEPHWLDIVQADPCGSVVPHVVPTHEYPVAQSAVVEHDVVHDVALHAYGSQGTVVTLWQVPAPSQVRLGE